MKLLLTTGLAGLLLLASSASAQVERAFPMDVTATDRAIGTVTVNPDDGAIRGLLALDSVVLRDAYLPGGELVDLELERLSIERRKYGFYVDGKPAPGLLDGLDLSIWRGRVRGQADSEVLLSFSNKGSRGWIQRAHSIQHLMPQPGEAGGWDASYSLWISERSLNELGSTLDGFCAYDRLVSTTGERTRRPVQPGNDVDDQSLGGNLGLGTCTLRECTIALETDWQLNQVFGNDLGAETAYVTTLTTASSDRYEQQISTVFTFPYVMFYTNSNDPWTSQDSGGSSVDVLYELQAAWAGNVPAGATLAQMLSGASLGGGVAWLDVLCNNEFNFSVCGNINGNTPFPVAVGPLNWDFIVHTHELGHNFDALHTHDYCPPLDQCAPSGYFGQCQNSQVCTNQGTIMSYCHLCSGGTSNVTTFFHPTVVNDMTNAANTCLPLYSGISVNPPTLVSSVTTTQVTAQIAGGIVGNVQLFYRYSGGGYSSLVMTNTVGNTYSADLPAAGCSDSPEFYIGYTSTDCGAVTAPPGGASSPFTASVGEATISFADDFEADLGWTAQNNGASSGDWQRGVPVNDSGWDHDPATDGDGSGACYLTQNQTGNTDVDNGSVTLFSPVLDMSGGAAQVSYYYFLKLTNADGTDKLLVEVSPNGGAGPWTTIASHTTNGNLAWRTHSIDMSTTGVTLGANMMVRFTANDTGTQSIVEAGVDGFAVSSVTCGGGGGPTAYCDPGNGNSFSAGGAILAHVSGDPGQVMVFSVSDYPGTPGILFFGPGQGDSSFGCGRLCVTGLLQRSPVYIPQSSSFQPVFDTTGIASSPFNIQFWYRDVANQGACGDVFNTSNALGF
jgi:hypothetical protein